MAAKHNLAALLCLMALCSLGSQAQSSTCSFTDYNIPLPFAGCGQIGRNSLRGCPFCVKAYNENDLLKSCGPALDQLGDSIPCGPDAPCVAGQICPVSPCPPICHTTCSTSCVSLG